MSDEIEALGYAIRALAKGAVIIAPAVKPDVCPDPECQRERATGQHTEGCALRFGLEFVELRRPIVGDDKT